jgi:hypothetical protein
MSVTLTPQRQQIVLVPFDGSRRRNTLLLVTAILALVIGVGSIAGGVFGAVLTYNQAVAENVTTPEDASIPVAAVRGPFTMLSQADIIEFHQLERTGGLRYAEMPRQIAQIDEAGSPVLDEAGEPVMVPNDARASWVTATTLTSALYTGVLAYGLSAFAIVVGLALAACGVVFLALRTPKEALV